MAISVYSTNLNTVSVREVWLLKDFHMTRKINSGPEQKSQAISFLKISRLGPSPLFPNYKNMKNFHLEY